MKFSEFLKIAHQANRLTEASRLMTRIAKAPGPDGPTITIDGQTFRGRDAGLLKRHLIDGLDAINIEAQAELTKAGISFEQPGAEA